MVLSLNELDTIGMVQKGKDNRYWEFPLKYQVSSVSLIHRILANIYWFVFVVLILLYSFALFCYLKIVCKKCSVDDEIINNTLANYKLFLNIYPTSIYPLIIKSYELALYNKYQLLAPSLELGTGDGYFTNLLYQNKINKLSIASDLTFSTLLQSRKYEFWEKLAIIDASQIPLSNNSQSTVIMNNLIHHLPDRDIVLDEVYRVLKPSGVFLFTDEYSSWATSQWHIKLNKKCLDKYLKQTVQCLLKNKQYWIDKSRGDAWELLEMKDFFSNKSMFLASVMETLNRKIGAPTPKPIINMLNRFPFLKKVQLYLTCKIAEILIINDNALCERYGSTMVFIAMRKKETMHNINKSELVCPICKNGIEYRNDGYYCLGCKIKYPIVDDVPFLISYVNELPMNVYKGSTEVKDLSGVSC